MRASDTKEMQTKFRSLQRRTFLVCAVLGLVVLLAPSFGCGGPPPSGGSSTQADSGSAEIPQLTDEVINERINDAWVREVLPENETAPPITWSFDHHEPKEIKVVERQVNGTQATIVLDIKTESAPGARNVRSLAGQIRTEWRLQTGWVLRKWEIVKTENISMKYKDAPAPALPQNSNR